MYACVTAASSKVGGIRFAEANAASAAHSHVHFDEKLHDSVVMVIPESDGNFLVKVSFWGSGSHLHIYICMYDSASALVALRYTLLLRNESVYERTVEYGFMTFILNKQGF